MKLHYYSALILLGISCKVYNKKTPLFEKRSVIIMCRDCPRYARSASLVRTAHRQFAPASRLQPNPLSRVLIPLASSNKKTLLFGKRSVFLLVMRFPVIANWSKLPQTFAYKRFEEGIGFCESTDFLLESLSSLLELV